MDKLIHLAETNILTASRKIYHYDITPLQKDPKQLRTSKKKWGNMFLDLARATDFEIARPATSRAATSGDELAPRILKSAPQPPA